MRIILGLIVILVAALFVWPLVSYGTLDPCRILAKDMARDTYEQMANAVGAEPGKTPEAAESMARMVTSQYSEGRCLSRLKDRWLGLESTSD